MISESLFLFIKAKKDPHTSWKVLKLQDELEHILVAADMKQEIKVILTIT